MNQLPKMRATEWVLLVMLGIIWGGSFFFAKIAVEEVPPLTLVLFRVSLGAIFLGIYIALSGRNFPLGWAVWGAFLLMGLINNVIPFSLLFWGQTQISSGLASILNATTPIFTVIVAHLFTQDEKLNWHKMLGVVLGFAGVSVMLGAGFTDASVANPPIAMLACLGAGVSYAFAGVFGRRFARLGVGPARVALGQLAGSSLIMLPIVIAFDPPIAPLGYATSTLLSVLGLAVVCTAFAYILFFRILATGGATNLSLVTLIVPASAIVLGSVFLNEQLGFYEIVGLGLIALGLLTTDGRVFRSRPKTG